jgi:hypothetical protein
MSVSRRAVVIVRSFFLVCRSFYRLIPATVASTCSTFSFITLLLTLHLVLHELGSMKLCSSTFCAAEWQLPLMLCLAASVYRVYWTGCNNGRGLLNAAGHVVRLRLKCDGTRAETRFRLSAKGTSPFKLAGASVQSTTGSRGVRISGSNAGYTMFRGSVNSTYSIRQFPLHFPSRASPYVITFQLDCTYECLYYIHM